MHLLASSLLLAIPAGVSAQSAEMLAPGQTLLQVQATGESYAAPDMASVSGGVVTFAATSREAASSNADAMNTVVAALRKAGVAARDIQTQNLSLNPEYNYNRSEGQPPAITGYQATNSVTVRVRDVKKASDLLTVMFDAGANNVSGPNFSLSDDTDAVAKARTAAVAEAKAEAEAYAAAFDMKVVRVIRISERSQSAQYEPIIVTGSRIGAPPPPPPPPPVSAPAVEVGEMQQSVTLFVDYALGPR
ncbi:SIMPL domain-containing protein [Erythrobacter sp. LQ02-29]|uniref:SIMPL domain-containing protein n=1 Tax=Erythrobacter sp. LQ02-29 TaxID=2920384 RepID=UPI001F4D386F|nr:SIMPL domain-containing protein [Erythrobacter sp. LQ02-29]MCP9222989.1 SIMPL domain-containing protein [Erythrobacter sp. LQ02-29]